MTTRRISLWVLVMALIALVPHICPLLADVGTAQPQEQSEAKPAAEEHKAERRAQGPAGQLEEASREAAGEDETAEFKHSATVRWLAGITGLTPFAAYWVFVALNFVIIAVLLVALLKSKLPAAFRGRTASIQQGIAEARQASEEARHRLGEIENRLSKLDSEIAALTESGSVVELIEADEGSAQAMGLNLMDPSAIPAAVGEGIRQGESAASRLREFWSAG